MKNSFVKTLILALTVALSFSLVACGSVSGGQNSTCNHKLVVDEAINPTCESIGLTEGSYCELCGKLLLKQEVVPALGHNYENNVCTRCGEKDPESIPHEHVIVIDKAVEPTCEEVGLTEGKHCEICDKVIVAQEQIPALEHKEVQDIGYNSTCTQTGLTNGVHCERCGKVLTAQEVIETVPHTPSDWIIDKHSSIHEEGSQHKECTVCFEVLETEVLPKGYSSGFDYQVNEDDKTLTITGIGDCEDAEVGIPQSINGYTVTAIGEKAFSEQTQITQIALPETLKSIGIRAFYGCTGLTEFTLPKNVTSIGSQIFYKCSNLSTVYYNCNYGSSSNPFMSVANIKTVIFGGTEIPSYALKNCPNVTSVTIDDNITSIGYQAFFNCSSLTSIEIPDSVTEIGVWAFESCTSLQNIYITDLTAWCNISGLNYLMLYNSSSKNLYLNNELVTNLVIPDSITSIGDGAFHGCSSLTSVEIPDSVTSIGKWVFANCTSLTSIEIPDSVTSIGNCVFEGCNSLTSVEILDSVISIGDQAFRYCSSLTSIEIPDSVTYIGNYVWPRN